MNKFFIISFLLLLFSCSLDTKSGFWSDQKEIKNETKLLKKVFKKEKILKKEFNPTLSIKLSSKVKDNNYQNNTNNNTGRINFVGQPKKISKFKFSKIDNFSYFEPELIFHNQNLIFFDDKSSIIKFDKTSKIIWKKNFYSKSERKLKPILNFGKIKDTLIVTDNISKYYAININNGELIWSHYNSSPFNSQIKIYEDKFLVVDFKNILRCFSIKDGKELWNIKSGDTFLKSGKRLSLIVVNNLVYFNNSFGDIIAIDINTGERVWETPTQNSSIYENAFFLKTSDLIANQKAILFSNNKNEFYSLDLKTGILNWKQKINSYLRSTIINDLIFSVSNEGYLFVMDFSTGKILRATDVFDHLSKKKRKEIFPEGFIVGIKEIYITTSNGKLLIVDISSGKTVSVLKIDNNKISRPFVSNKNMFIVKENSIIKLN